MAKHSRRISNSRVFYVLFLGFCVVFAQAKREKIEIPTTIPLPGSPAPRESLLENPDLLEPSSRGVLPSMGGVDAAENDDLGEVPAEPETTTSSTTDDGSQTTAINLDITQAPRKGSDNGGGFFDFRQVYTTTSTTPKPLTSGEEPDYIFLGPVTIRASNNQYNGVFQLLGDKDRNRTASPTSALPSGKVELTLRRLDNNQWVTLATSDVQDVKSAITPLNIALNDKVRSSLKAIAKSITNIYNDDESDKLRLYLSGEFNGKSFLRYARVSYDARNTTVFIQTDKGIYKPGETVKFRVLAVDLDGLKPVNDPIDITIEDSSKNLIRKWNGVQGKKMPGYVTDKLELSTEPVLGEWKIVASLNGIEKEAKFTIAKYVLPKFDVKIDFPSEVSVEDEKIIVNVKAKYTYGKPVKGELHVTSDCNNVERIYSCFDGSANVTFRNLFAGKKDQWWNPSCRVDVSLEEALTGKRQNATGSLTARKQSLDIKIDEPFGDFKPGLPYIIDIKLSHTDGKPIAKRYSNEKLILTTRINGAQEVREISTKELTNDTYRATFLTAKYATSMDVTVRFKDQTESRYKYASETTNNMNIQIQPESKTIGESEGKIQAELHWTQPVSKLSYLVIAQGRIVDSGEFDTSNAQPNSYNYYAQNITAKAVPPKTKLIVYAPQYNGASTIVDTFTFDVAGLIRNNVSVSVSPNARTEYARPGESATITVDAEPQSLLGLLAVDKSVRLLKDLNDVTRTDILKTVTEAQDDYHYYDRSSYVLDAAPAFTRSSEPIQNDASKRSIYESERGCDDFFSSRLLVISSICKSEDRPRPANVYYAAQSLAFDTVRSPVGGSGAALPIVQYESFAFDAVAEGGRESSAPLLYISTTTRPTVLAAAAPPSGLRRTSSKASSEQSDAPAPRVRQDFPETWIWLDDIANSSTTTFNKTVPDTITTWLVKAVALHPEHGLGVSNDFAELRVFQPFFVSMQLPYSVVRNELVYLQVSVFNYNEEPQDVEVKLEFDDNGAFEFDTSLVAQNDSSSDANGQQPKSPNTKLVKVPAQDGATVTFPIRPRRLGDQPLTASARVTSGTSQLADVEKRKLKVIAEGKPVYYNVPLFIDLRNQTANENGGGEKTVSVPILFPRESENFVKDSEHVQVSVTGDLMAPTIRGLANLVRLPRGCGEQNMVDFVPNILVLRYLQAVNRLTDDLKETSMEYLRKGYQRQLQYRHADGSYSAFGESDGRGSTWLTAFVLKSFAQAVDGHYLDIDRNSTRQSLQWLLRQQERDGMFSEKGKILSTRMQGGTGSTTSTLNIPLTAYSLIALAHNHVSHNALERSASYLVSQRSSYTNEPYSLAIATYALELVKSRASQQTLASLERMQQRDPQGRVYWSEKKQNESTTLETQARLGYYYKPPPADVEMTAYVLLTYVLQKNVEKAVPVARWLIAQRSDQGGFTSTQDTVIALEALEKFSALVFEANQAVQISVTAQGSTLQTNKFTVDNNNAVLYQEQDLKIDPTVQELRVTAKGSGAAIVDVAYRYNVKDDKGIPSFRLQVDTKEPSALNGQINVCVEYLKPNLPSMVLVEAELPSGYEADPDDISQLLTRYKGVVSRIDVEQRNTRVVVYFDQLKRTGNCVSFNAYRKFAVDDLKPKTITVYDYYDPRDCLTTTYQLGKEENICENWIDNSLPCPPKN